MSEQHELSDADVVIVRTSATEMKDSGRGFVLSGVALTGKTSGSKQISMQHGILMPGKKVTPHYHPYELVSYSIRGTHRIRYGKNLEKYIDVVAGDFVLIPPYVIHAPESNSDEPMEYVVALPAPEEIILMPPWVEGPYEH